MRKLICYILFLGMLCSCSTTKNIPDGEYLMNGYNIKADTKNIETSYYEDFIRQQPNNKIRLRVYNLAGQDSGKWLNRQIKKLGQAPVIYSPRLTKISAEQLQAELNNQGYLRAEVDTILKPNGKKMNIVYDIKNNGIYTIRNYEYTINDSTIARSLRPARKYTRIQSGVIFNKENLDNSTANLTTYLRNIGYFNFSKEYLYFRADTTLNSHQADVFLSLYEPRDSTDFKRFKIRNVYITSGSDPLVRGNSRLFADPDTTQYKGLTLIHGKNKFLRNSTLYRNNFIRPGDYYADMRFTRTASAFNSMSVIKQTTINFTSVSAPSDSVQYLDAQINIAPGNTHFFQAEIQGTNSAGDLGIAPILTYQHRNLFNGAEILNIKLRGAYEFISNVEDTDLSGKNYYEYGADVSLSFPQFLFPWLKKSWREWPSASTEISVGFNNQNRKEYTRQFFNAGLTYRWASKSNQLNHALSLWNINYVRMPWASTEFANRYLVQADSVNSMIRESYKDQLISSTTYGITYTNINNRYGRIPVNQVTVRANIDISGWLPRLATTLHKAERDTTGSKKIFGIAYAEYIKGDISFAQTHRLNRRSSVAYHIGLGVAQPFGNSRVLPFESRYFSGGANSVRGWQTRALGPGSMPDSISDFVNKVGDIKLDLNIEYRRKVSDLIELAGFIDAGNVWTIKNYDAQPDGLFKFTEFYKEIALSYGVGTRFDLGFLLLRFDFGFRAYNPGREKGTRWVTPNFSGKRMAWHFAIGYPF